MLYLASAAHGQSTDPGTPDMPPQPSAPAGTMIQGSVEQRATQQYYSPQSVQQPPLGYMQPQLGQMPATLPYQGQVQRNDYAQPMGGMQIPQLGVPMPPPNMLQGNALQNNPFMPAWLPAYAQALTAAMPRAPMQGAVEEDGNVDRPSYIPGFAYSNSAMVSEYHNMDTLWMDKRPIPPKPQWMKLSPSVVRFWKGYKEDPYWVKSVPDAEHPGNFVFFSAYPGGPKGWLQFTNKPGKFGFPQYRYWFDPR
ncbi:MAG TPA: hypothetical protein V6C81_18945 [Planktothrix sp.]